MFHEALQFTKMHVSYVSFKKKYLKKKKEGKDFDVTMGDYGGTEIYEFVSMFMLLLTGKKYISEK